MQCFRHHIHTAAYHISHDVHCIHAGIDHGLHTDHGIPPILQDVVHIRQHILAGGHDHFRRIHDALEGLQHDHIILQLLLHSIQRVCHTDLTVCIHHRKRIAGFHDRLRHSTDERSIYLLLHGIFRLACDLGCNAVLFLVFIIIDRRMIHFTVYKSQHFLRESLRNDQRCIIVAVLHALQGFFRGLREYPADGSIRFQGFQHAVSHIQGQSHDLRSGIIRSDRNLQLTGSRRFIRIPVGENIEPGIQCRQDA